MGNLSEVTECGQAELWGEIEWLIMSANAAARRDTHRLRGMKNVLIVHAVYLSVVHAVYLSGHLA